MKKTALMAAVIALLCATPAMAQNGYVGLDYKQTDNLDDGENWDLHGAYGFNASTNWGFQIDGSVGSGELDAGLDVDTYNLTGHAFYTGASGWRLGGVLGVSNADLGAGLEFEDVTYGVEGTYDFGTQTVVSGAATFGETDFIGIDFDTWNLDAGIDFYATPNLRFGANVGTGNLEFGASDFDNTTFGLDAEWQPWAMPVSLTAGYSTFEDDLFVDGDSFRIGARWNFGGGTLQERDEATPFDTQTAYAQRLFDIR